MRHLPFAVGLGLVGGLAFVLGGGTRRRGRPARTGDRGHSALIAYLREHLSGADAAIRVVDRLRRTQTDEQPLFEWLHEEFTADREIVRGIVTSLGASAKSPKRALARTSAAAIERLAGGERGELSLFRTLEALAIGVQGKRCLWRALQSMGPALPVPGSRTLPDLEAAAVRQWEAIERARALAVPHTFGIAAGEPAR